MHQARFRLRRPVSVCSCATAWSVTEVQERSRLVRVDSAASCARWRSVRSASLRESSARAGSLERGARHSISASCRCRTCKPCSDPRAANPRCDRRGHQPRRSSARLLRPCRANRLWSDTCQCRGMGRVVSDDM